MSEQSGNEAVRQFRQAVLAAFLIEGIGVVLEQREMQMQSRAIVRFERLRHEGGVDVVLHCNFLHGEPGRHEVVRHGQCVGVAQVELVLARRHFVVRRAHRDAEPLQCKDRGSPVLVGDVEGGEIEVAATVEHLRIGAAVPEVEVLDLRADIGAEAEVVGPFKIALQHPPRVAGEWLAVGSDDVAEHAAYVSLRAPRQDLKGCGVGPRQHVLLLVAREPIDRAAVELHALGESNLELCRRDRERLQEAEDVCEPQPDEADASFLDGSQHILFLFLHW